MGGKSAIPEGIDFAMTGRLAKFRKLNADGWITKGEKSGYFQITLEDGTTMRRSRTRGSRTEIVFTCPGQKPATQEDAEIAFYKHIGFDESDANTIAYFEQDMMNRIVRTEPEKRFQLIRAWLGLQKGEDAEKEATEIVKTRTRAVMKLRAQRASLISMMPEEVEGPPLEELEKEHRDILAEIEEVSQQRKAFTSVSEDVSLVARYDAIVVEGKEVAEAVKEIPDDLEERLSSAEEYLATQQSAWDAARKESATKKKVSLGQFDGKCPVADIACPATKQINGNLSASKATYDAAVAKEVRCAKALATAKSGIEQVRQEANDAFYKRTHYDDLRSRAESLLEKVRDARKRVKTAAKKNGGLDLEAIEEQLENLDTKKSDILQAIAERKANARQRASLQEQLKTCEEDLERETKLAATATVTRTTFRAAQRRVSEQALEKIGEGANKMFRDSEIDLTIDVQWEREGDGYAKSCEMCGSAFPASAKVKRCETCDAERGQNIQQKLEFILSDRSGAADDFAGIGLQLSAGSYLLRLRQSSWGTVSVDEPFAKMDQTIRRAAAKQLVKLLGSGVYRQMMVISHSQDTVDIFPGRINIFVARDGTRSIVTK